MFSILGTAIRLGWRDKKWMVGAGTRNQGGNSLCISDNALWQSSNTNGY